LVTTPQQSLDESVCLPCGKLLSLFRDGWGGQLGIVPKYVRLDTRLTEMGMDSLDMVSMVMELEELYVLEVTDEEAGKLLTLADLIRWIRRHERERCQQD
jgi:acyl carrier protein